MSGPGAYVVEIEGLARVRLRVVVRGCRDADRARAEAAAFAESDGAAWRTARIGGAQPLRSGPATAQRIVGHWPASAGDVARAFAAEAGGAIGAGAGG